MGNNFVLEFLRHSKEVGSLLPSSRFLANAMLENVPVDKIHRMVEYGSGTGTFTKVAQEL
ncbi:MAG: hypothetical protein H7249_14050 [Chitinophagaceae bacterium]|nr:hypothetical protein [Oligoflexus sp.]